ncbi:MAG: hypothetical protein COV74_04565 [Candidatus Omnitrophica bacterium CG11_big_fil_rev_8_21_14_0_20_45_26]|uniref:mannose-1-phosphate guanylyltransferase n=1 Tax=Candidatus Abzuiibacterium crystallinum TaxID=1974748 RepID=A0A2H0LPV8_9BACT|nr:MAG: hypothetical protein COV74_04565 [Candidatus Omnitrophica bacterium CG11_big_fil_rev_8_21_14_0_20_45_26]PIW65627.1 MAG: hypothetical protein COW12_00925 [Candidatus Omnitrophica bacterium CG12_big_fil_rev_8_21_14_0_65_45_16]
MKWAIVMAGGQGKRLWPLSRQNNPKQFLTLFGGKSLIEHTIDRIKPIVPAHRIWVITHQDYVARTRKLLKSVPAAQIIGEPEARNTAATIGLGVYLIQKRDPNAVVTVFPADHIILNKRLFAQAVLKAMKRAAHGVSHVLFGVVPTYPATAYGYIERTSKQTARQVFQVSRFIEKPHLKKAKQLFQNKKMYWQAGIFTFHINTFITSLQKTLPRHARQIQQITAHWPKGKASKMPKAHLFKQLSNISVDFGVMEKSRNIEMIPARFDWNDVGSWNALSSVWQRDQNGNAVHGSAVFLEAKHNLVRSSQRLTCLLGVNDLIVIDTDDSVLITTKHHAEQVKQLTDTLKLKI